MQLLSRIDGISIALCCATCLLLLGANAAISQENTDVLGAGSPERRKICEAIADMFVTAHQSISEGNSFERVQKELEIVFAGQENKGDPQQRLLKQTA